VGRERIEEEREAETRNERGGGRGRATKTRLIENAEEGLIEVQREKRKRREVKNLTARLITAYRSIDHFRMFVQLNNNIKLVQLLNPLSPTYRCPHLSVNTSYYGERSRCLGIVVMEGREQKNGRRQRESRTELYRRTAVIDSAGQFTDGFTITIKLCSRGKLYS